jgi:hypothetical protein
MNPYLEQNDTWEDFHQNFITRAQHVLGGQLGPNYLVKIEVRIYVHELSAAERRFVGRAPAVEVQRESSLQIHDRRDRRVVTVIELLSPANKTPGADHDAYVGKRRSLLATRTHLVEIDLRRGGARPYPPELLACDYYVLVSRSEARPRLGIWPISLRERLPVVPIPLVAPDPDIALDLQAVLHHVYDLAGYAKYIYRETPQPPLTPNDAAWARQFVPQVTES